MIWENRDMSRETLKEEIIKRLERNKTDLFQILNNKVFIEYCDDEKLNICKEITFVDSLIIYLTKSKYDPFLCFEYQDEYKTIWSISDEDVEIIENDIESFISDLIYFMFDQQLMDAENSLKCDVITHHYISSIQRCIHKKKLNKE